MTKGKRGYLRGSLAPVVVLLPFFFCASRADAAQPHLIAPATVSIVATPGAIVESQPLHIAATVEGSSGNPTGIVQVQAADGAVLCNIELVDGAGTCTATPFLDGPDPNYQITGTYEGDSTYAGATGSTTISLAPAATATSLVSSSYSPEKFSW